VFAANYAPPTPNNLITATNDVITAYLDASGCINPDFVNLGAGAIGGLTSPVCTRTMSVTASGDVTIYFFHSSQQDTFHVRWFPGIQIPCTDTGMWKVKPDLDNTGNLAMSIIHDLDRMVHVHLMGIADGTPHHLTFDRSLDSM
jgi:hypothetical protein